MRRSYGNGDVGKRGWVDGCGHVGSVVRKVRRFTWPVGGQVASELEHVHATALEVAGYELTPAHPPREDTPEYRAAHTLLVETLDTPCRVCRVRKSTLGDPTQNRAGAKDIETHHYPIERSLIDACDWQKVSATFPQVDSAEALQTFVDSPLNLIVLCDVHHRSLDVGIHHLLVQDWAVLPFLLDDYQLTATAKSVQAATAHDEQVQHAPH